MGNKMFVQLFNVKNIHFGAWILCLASARLSRLQWRGRWPGTFPEAPSALAAGPGPVPGMLGVSTGEPPAPSSVPVPASGAGVAGPGTACSGAAEGSGPLFALPCPPAGHQRAAAVRVCASNCRGLTAARGCCEAHTWRPTPGSTTFWRCEVLVNGALQDMGTRH